MKKLYTENRWKKHSRRRQLAQLKSCRRRNRLLKGRGRAEDHLSKPARTVRRDRIHRHTIVAPKAFSLRENPNESLRFIREVRLYSRQRRRLYVDMEDVERLTCDAVAVLVACIEDKRSVADFAGNAPKDDKARSLLLGSGFFQHVARRFPRKVQDDASGIITRRESSKVEPETAKELITIATSQLWGDRRRAPGTYRTLIEAMTNTENHAAVSHEHPETWWASVYSDQEEQIAYFTFVDNGVGIFNSVKLQMIRQVFRAVGLTDNADVLRELLHGTIGSRTGLPYRGKGLPAMRDAVERGTIRDLVIVSNDVLADVANKRYSVLDQTLDGTVLTWELAK